MSSDDGWKRAYLANHPEDRDKFVLPEDSEPYYEALRKADAMADAVAAEHERGVEALQAQLDKIKADVDNLLVKLDGIDHLLDEAIALFKGEEV